MLGRVARPVRIEFSGALYFLRSQGNGSEPICRDREDRERLLRTLGEAAAKAGWAVQAYCVLDQELDLVLETPRPNLVAGMKWFLGSYAMRFRRRHGTAGPLFRGRYRSWLVDGTAPGYLRMACDQVHGRPAQGGLLRPGQRLRDYPWSSLCHYLAPPEQRPAWLQTARLLRDYGIEHDDLNGRQQLAERFEQGYAAQPAETAWAQRGWCLGGEDFRRRLLEGLLRDPGARPSGALRKEAAVVQAEALVREELRRAGLTEAQLPTMPKGAPAKVHVARRLRRETTVSFRWIAARLHMGSWTYVANLTYAQDRTAPGQRSRPLPSPQPTPHSPTAAEAETIPPPPETADDVLPVYCL